MAEGERFELSCDLRHAWFSRPARYDRFGIPPNTIYTVILTFIIGYMSEFKDRVIDTVRLINKGKVASYGQIALMIVVPRAAIQVGWVLHTSGGDGITPWWRVINKEGFISTKCLEHTKNIQKELLLKEGVKVNKNLKVDMGKYRWLPSAKSIKKLRLENDYLYGMLDKYKF